MINKNKLTKFQPVLKHQFNCMIYNKNLKHCTTLLPSDFGFSQFCRAVGYQQVRQNRGSVKDYQTSSIEAKKQRFHNSSSTSRAILSPKRSRQVPAQKTLKDRTNRTVAASERERRAHKAKQEEEKKKGRRQ